MSKMIRDHEVNRDFAVTREHRMAHIDRLYDFDDEPVAKTVTAIDAADGEVFAAFLVEPNGKITNLTEPAPHPQDVTRELVGIPTDHDDDWVNNLDLNVGIVTPEDTEPIPATPGKVAVMATDSDTGVSLGELLAFARDLADSNLPVETPIKAWTNEYGDILRLAALT